MNTKNIANLQLQINHTIDHILTKGSKILYNNYLDKKMPNDCHERVTDGINHNFYMMVHVKPELKNIESDQMPKSARMDNNTPSKIKVRPVTTAQGRHYKSQTQIFCNTQPYSSRSKLQSQSQGSARFSVKKQRNSGKKFQFKTLNENLERDHCEENLRKEKKHNELKSIQKQKKTIEIEQQQKTKRSQLQAKINTFLKQGVNYIYEDDGKISGPNKKGINQKVIPRNNSKPFNLRFKAIQVLSANSNITKQLQILGKTKRYSSSIIKQNVQKMSDQQYNNRHRRQQSNVPFLSLEDGTKIIERQKNVTAEKPRKSTKNRQQYSSESKRKGFTKFKSQEQQSPVFKNSNERPATHSFNRLRPHNLFSTISVSTRPKTSSNPHRVTISNQELANQLIRY